MWSFSAYRRHILWRKLVGGVWDEKAGLTNRTIPHHYTFNGLHCERLCAAQVSATEPKMLLITSHTKVFWSMTKNSTWGTEVQHEITITWTVLASGITDIFIHIPRITGEMQRTGYAIKTSLYIMNFKTFYKSTATSAWQFKTVTFINTRLYHEQSILQPFIYFISSSLQYFIFKIWYARTITSIHVAPQWRMVKHTTFTIALTAYRRASS